MPPDTPRKPNEPLPTIRRKHRTEFALNDKLLTSPNRVEDEALAKLELEFEIQSKIVAAQMKLMNEVGVKKNVKKKRKECYELSKAKLDLLEKQLMPLRKELEESRKAKKSKRHLIQELNMKGCPIFDTTDGQTVITGLQQTMRNNTSNDGFVNHNGQNNNLKGVLTNSNGQTRNGNKDNGQFLVSALTTALKSDAKDGQQTRKQKKQVRIKESNSTPSSPVISRANSGQRERTMSGCVTMDIRSSLRANDVQTGRHIVDGFGNSIHVTPSNGSAQFLRPFDVRGSQTMDARHKYDHLTREDIPNLNAPFVPMSPAKRRLMRTQAQRANNHSIDSGLRTSSVSSSNQTPLAVPLSKHGSIDTIDTTKSRHNSEQFGKSMPRNPPPPVPHPHRMAQRPLPPTPGHGHFDDDNVFESTNNVHSGTLEIAAFSDSSQQLDSMSSLDSNSCQQINDYNQRIGDVVDCGVHINTMMRKGGSSSSSIESDLMPPPPSLPPKVPKKIVHRPSPLTIPEYIHSSGSASSCERTMNVSNPETMSFNGSISNQSNLSNGSNHDSFSNRGSLAAESFLSLEMPMTPSYIPRPEVETPRPLPVPVTPTVNIPNAEIVSVGQYQAGWEETKSFEMADVYKYSAKHRARQRQASTSGLPTMISSSSTCESNIVNSQPVGGNCVDAEHQRQTPSIEVTSPTSGFNTPAVSGDFCDEMLDWYDGHIKNPTVV